MGSQSSFDENAKRCLTRLIRRAFPHSGFPDGPYARAADSIVSQAEDSLPDKLNLAAGLASLDAAAGGSFADLDDAAADEIIAGIVDAPFFHFVRAITVVTLYNDPESWKLLGYEGASFDQGGYLHRGFDDLDWLPDPRVEEYDGPDQLVEVAPADEPSNAGGSN